MLDWPKATTSNDQVIRLLTIEHNRWFVLSANLVSPKFHDANDDDTATRFLFTPGLYREFSNSDCADQTEVQGNIIQSKEKFAETPEFCSGARTLPFALDQAKGKKRSCPSLYSAEIAMTRTWSTCEEFVEDILRSVTSVVMFAYITNINYSWLTLYMIYSIMNIILYSILNKKKNIYEKWKIFVI